MDNAGAGAGATLGGGGHLRELVGAARPLERHSWVEVVAERPDVAEKTLHELGFEDTTVRRRLDELDEARGRLQELDNEYARVRRQTGAHYAPPAEVQAVREQRDAALEKLWDLVRGVSVQPVAEETATVWVPLFVLSAPAVPGCSAAFDIEVMSGRALGWNVTLIGAGISGADRLRATSEYRFKAETGETKQVLVPVDVTVQRCTLLRWGRPRGETYQTYVGDSEIEAVVPKLLEHGAVPPLGDLARRYRLSADPSGGLSGYTQKYQRSGERSHRLGLKAFGTELAITAEVEQDENVALLLDLVGGYDYTAHYPAQVDGYLWADAVRPSLPSV